MKLYHAAQYFFVSFFAKRNKEQTFPQKQQRIPKRECSLVKNNTQESSQKEGAKEPKTNEPKIDKKGTLALHCAAKL